MLIIRSSTHERKSKSYVVMKKDRIYLTHNVLNEDISIAIIFKAMGIVSHQEMMLICTGSDAEFQDQFALNFEEADRLGVYTQEQALEFLGSKIKILRKPVGFGGPRRNHAQEALEALASVIIPHVIVRDLNFSSFFNDQPYLETLANVRRSKSILSRLYGSTRPFSLVG